MSNKEKMEGAPEKAAPAHTAGPWRAANGKGSAAVKGPDCAIYVNVRTVETPECVARWQADAVRIVACVNACEGLSTEQVEGVRVKDLIAGGWQPISTAPRDGKFYLATNGREFVVVNEPPGCARGIWTRSRGRYKWVGMIHGPDDLTHWMPLPAPPVPSLDAKGEPGKGE